MTGGKHADRIIESRVASVPAHYVSRLRNIGPLLCKLREKKKISLQDMVDKGAVEDKTTLWRYESESRSLPLEQLDKICAVLGCLDGTDPLIWLFDELTRHGIAHQGSPRISFPNR